MNISLVGVARSAQFTNGWERGKGFEAVVIEAPMRLVCNGAHPFRFDRVVAATEQWEKVVMAMVWPSTKHGTGRGARARPPHTSVLDRWSPVWTGALMPGLVGCQMGWLAGRIFWATQLAHPRFGWNTGRYSPSCSVVAHCAGHHYVCCASIDPHISSTFADLSSLFSPLFYNTTESNQSLLRSPHDDQHESSREILASPGVTPSSVYGPIHCARTCKRKHIIAIFHLLEQKKNYWHCIFFRL
jgi:hypothetical protein